MSPERLLREVPGDRLVVAIDPGKVSNRVWITTGDGVIGEPLSLPTSRTGLDRLGALVAGGGSPLFALEATGALHRAWAAELRAALAGVAADVRAVSDAGREDAAWDAAGSRPTIVTARRWSGSPARAPGSLRRMLRWRPCSRRSRTVASSCSRSNRCGSDFTISSTRSRPWLSAPKGHGRAFALETATGRAVLACAVDFAGRAPGVRSLQARADGRLRDATATFWSTRWRDCLAPPPDAGLRAARMGRDLTRFDALREDIAFVDDQIEPLLAASAGEILTTLPGVSTTLARGIRRLHAPDRTLPDPGAALLRHRPGAGQL